MATSFTAPIVAVTVYPGQARVTRRGAARLAPGQHRILVGGLPLGLFPDSVRVSGHGPATVLGVDVVDQRHPRSPAAGIAELTERLRARRAELSELDDQDAVEAGRIELLKTVSARTGKSFAKAVAADPGHTARVAEVADLLAGQLGAVLGRRRELAERRRLAQQEHDALDRELAQLAAQHEPDRKAVVVDVEAHEDADVELELSYVVNDARWESSYDLRLHGDSLTLTWHGLVTQRTGEDWPECELRLSTARPASTATVPELTPWYLDRRQPPVRPVPMAAAYGGPPPAPGSGPSAPTGQERPAMAVAEATAESAGTATTYRPARPVAVPSDGSAHRTVLMTAELDAALDHVTAPVRSQDAYLRATVVNTAANALRAGKASVFHEAEFVGTTKLPPWAPGEEIELNLGVDERVRVERELVRRTAGKAVLGGSRRREAEYRITVGNFGSSTAKVTVLDQVPVSRDENIVVRDVRGKPEPTERDDLGGLTWQLRIPPGETAEITLSFRVDLARGVEMTGWRD